VEFPSPVEAVRCALGVQEALASEAAQEPSQTLASRDARPSCPDPPLRRPDQGITIRRHSRRVFQQSANYR
jgi:hypothetical protein